MQTENTLSKYICGNGLDR